LCLYREKKMPEMQDGKGTFDSCRNDTKFSRHCHVLFFVLL
jgi:hypothetical protein